MNEALVAMALILRANTQRANTPVCPYEKIRYIVDFNVIETK
jgi:hypothetical protein